MYFAIKWPKAMASLALPGAIDAVREKKIIAVSLVSAERLVREVLAGDVGGEHEPTLRDREDRHASLIVAIRRGIRRLSTRLRRHAIGTDAGRRACGNGDGTRTRVEFEFTRFKFIQITLIFEENDLAIRFAAGLESDAQLRHRRVADQPVMHIHVTFTSCAADNEPSRADGREHRITIAIVEKYSALSGMLEKLDGLVVVAGVSHTRPQQ